MDNDERQRLHDERERLQQTESGLEDLRARYEGAMNCISALAQRMGSLQSAHDALSVQVDFLRLRLQKVTEEGGLYTIVRNADGE